MPRPDRTPPRSRIIAPLIASVSLLGGLLLFGRPRAPSATAERYGPATGRGGHGTPPSGEAVAVGYETHDASAPAIAKWMAGLALLAAVAIALMLGMLRYFHAQRAAEQPAFSPQQTGRVEPPSPRLQAQPYDDLEATRRHADSLLNSYEWLDAAHDRARIPIARAMALTVGRPLDGSGGTAQ